MVLPSDIPWWTLQYYFIISHNHKPTSNPLNRPETDLSEEKDLKQPSQNSNTEFLNSRIDPVKIIDVQRLTQVPSIHESLISTPEGGKLICQSESEAAGGEDRLSPHGRVEECWHAAPAWLLLLMLHGWLMAAVTQVLIANESLCVSVRPS